MEKKLSGYALILALVLVAIFSIIVESLGQRSSLYNQTQMNIISSYKLNPSLTNPSVQIQNTNNSISIPKRIEDEM
jgi:hypothetical protein